LLAFERPSKHPGRRFGKSAGLELSFRDQNFRSTRVDPVDVNREFAALDGQYHGNAIHSFDVGASALANIRRALEVSGETSRQILDFSCGAGRVTRWLRAAFPSAAIEGCDLRESDLQFVSKTFGVRTWTASIDVNELLPTSRYDLIWVGSVFTHLSKDISVQLFDRLVSWLNPRGILVFTSHGRRVASDGSARDFYGIPQRWERVVEDFDRTTIKMSSPFRQPVIRSGNPCLIGRLLRACRNSGMP
jgi:2-polyprenyl-3-methyl-5-hydroxy-6-metoxy-1,4-benzoquinol methylase